jgi:hypothetical protein
LLHRLKARQAYHAVQCVPEGRKVEADIQVDLNVCAANLGKPGHTNVGQWVEVCLAKRLDTGRVLRIRVAVLGPMVPEDGRVDTAREAVITEVGYTSDPVIIDLLVGIQDEGVTLADAGTQALVESSLFLGVHIGVQDLDGIDDERLGADTIGFDDGHFVTVDAVGAVSTDDRVHLWRRFTDLKMKLGSQDIEINLNRYCETSLISENNARERKAHAFSSDNIDDS